MAADQQFWGSAARGGYFTNNRLSAQLRHALTPLMKFRQFVDVKEGWGKGVGDTLYFNKISTIATAGAALTETNTIPEHAFAISRGTITLTEYGNSVPFTGKLEALSEYDVTNPISRVLRDDMARRLDYYAGLEFRKTKLKYIASSTALSLWETLAGAAETIASAKNAKGGWRLFHIREVVDRLKQNNVPKYDGENYMCIASVNFMRQIRKDSDWQDAVKYGDPERLFAGEVGRIEGVRFIEETNCLIDTLGSGADLGEAVVFGKECVIEGIAIPEMLRAKVPTDYGRSKGIAWYALLGWERMWKVDDAGQYAHIIHLTSAA